MYTPMADLCYAFGVSERKVTYCVAKYHQNNQSSERKTRSDRGQTIFNFEKKRKGFLNAKAFYKRARRKRHSEPISDGQPAGAYRQLDDNKYAPSVRARRRGSAQRHRKYYGCQGVWNRVHHKNNIDKLLVICASAVVSSRRGGCRETGQLPACVPRRWHLALSPNCGEPFTQERRYVF